MASDDIAVPDIFYFIENDLRNALQQMEEDGQNGSTTSLPLEERTSINAPNRNALPAANKKTRRKPKKNKRKKSTEAPPSQRKTPKKFLSPVRRNLTHFLAKMRLIHPSPIQSMSGSMLSLQTSDGKKSNLSTQIRR